MVRTEGHMRTGPYAVPGQVHEAVPEWQRTVYVAHPQHDHRTSHWDRTAPVLGGRLRVRETGLFDISYLILGSHCARAQPARAVLFDLGCARFRSAQTSTASSSGDSIPLLINMYKKSCLRFDKIWAWESTKYRNWWARVPETLKERIVFANEGVNATVFEAALLTVAPHEYVVVKLDIDNTRLEMSIIDVVIKHARLVDELFFEYHYYFDGLNFGWGSLANIRHTHNAWTAVNLMARLRRMGIRAHFWV